MKNNSSILARIAILAGLAVGAFTLSALATWTDAPPNPPSGNAEAPINVGSTEQTKVGTLKIGLDSANNPISGKSLITGAFSILSGNFIFNPGGTITPGQVLTAMYDDGTVGWAAPSGGSGTTASLDALCTTTWIPPYRLDWGDWSTNREGTRDTTIRRSITPVSLLINGRNVCTDDNGCTYRIWQTSPTSPQGFNFYGSSPIMFRQIASGKIGAGKWIDAWGNQKGINGDYTETALIGTSHYGTSLIDDLDFDGNSTNRSFISNINDTKNPGSSSFLPGYPTFTPSISIENDIWWSEGVGGSVINSYEYSEHSPDWVSIKKEYYDGEIDPVVDIVTICDL